jgi:hypothetical protein
MNLYDREAGVTLSLPSRFISDVKAGLVEGFLIDDGNQDFFND